MNRGQIILFLLSLCLRLSFSQGTDCSVIWGPILAVAIVVETVTITTAIASCVYLKFKLKRVGQETRETVKGQRKPDTSDCDNVESGDKTIRVVHNSLYQSYNENSPKENQREEIRFFHASYSATAGRSTGLNKTVGVAAGQSPAETDRFYEPGGVDVEISVGTPQRVGDLTDDRISDSDNSMEQSTTL